VWGFCVINYAEPSDYVIREFIIYHVVELFKHSTDMKIIYQHVEMYKLYLDSIYYFIILKASYEYTFLKNTYF
jgi:hypothetical protein